MLWSLIFMSSYFFLFFSETSNIPASLGCSIFITPFAYITLRDLTNTVAELMSRLTDYESLNLFTFRLLSSLDSRKNLLSILEGICKSSDHKSLSSLKTKNAIRKVLYRRIFKCRRSHDQEVIFSSPATKLFFSLVEKLDFIDEPSLKAFFTSLHKLSSSLRLNAKKLRAFIVAEKVKYKVLQVASSMTLGFMIKTLSIFMNFSSFALPNLLTLTSFAILSIIFFIVFPSIIQLRHPSFKELALCIFIFLTFMISPPYGGA